MARREAPLIPLRWQAGRLETVGAPLLPPLADGVQVRAAVGPGAADPDVDEALLNELVQGPLKGRPGDSPFAVGLDVRELNLTVVRDDPALFSRNVLFHPSLRHEDQEHSDSGPPQRVEYIRGN